MSKNVLIISSSPRKGGNSEVLAGAFAKGAEEAGNQVETIYLREKQYGFCKGCLACQKTGRCVIQDDAVEVAEKMHHADVLAFATPVYYYSVSGQLKTMFDRANCLQLCLYGYLPFGNRGGKQRGSCGGHSESGSGLGRLLRKSPDEECCFCRRRHC